MHRNLTLAIFLFLSLNTHSHGQNYVVTNLNDSGIGSLRQAIIDANAYSTTSSPTTVSFLPGLNGTVTLSSMLPVISQTRGMTIDGSGAIITISGGASNLLSGN